MSYKDIIISLVVLLIASILLFGIAISRRINKLKADSKRNIVMHQNKSLWFLTYKKLSEFILTRRYLSRIRRLYEVYEPYDIKKVGIKTMKVAATNWLLSLVISIVALVISPTFLMSLTVVMALVILNDYRVYEKTGKEEIKFLKQFDTYLGNLRHYFYTFRSVEDAVYESANDTPNPLKIHIERIYEVLDSEDIDSAINNYSDVAPNRFIKLFLSACVMIQKFGDKEIDGESMFLANILHLKKDVNEEINKREKLTYRLTGFVPLAVLPMCSLKLIQNWALSNVEGLENFYYGVFGIILTVIIIVGTVIAYIMLVDIKQLKEARWKEHKILRKISKVPLIKSIIANYKKKNYGEYIQNTERLRRIGESISIDEFYIKRMVYSLITFILTITICFVVHENNKRLICNNTENFTNERLMASNKQLELLNEVVIEYTNRYKNDNNILFDEIEMELTKTLDIKNKRLIEITSEEIYTRVIEYQQQYVRWYEVLLCICLSIIAYFIEYWYLRYRESLIQMNMEDEVIQFQTLIIMMMHVERICVNDILNSMEDYAIIFKKSIAECINEYPSGDMEALENLKEKEPFPLFQHLVDNLIMCDQIGIKKAFDEVLIERHINQEKRKFDNEVLIGKKVLKGTIIAWVPFTIIIALYLIIPFMTESVTAFIEYENEINQVSELNE